MNKQILLKLYELNGLITSLNTLQELDDRFFNPMNEKVADAMQEIIAIVKEDQYNAAARSAADERGQIAIRHIG